MAERYHLEADASDDKLRLQFATRSRLDIRGVPYVIGGKVFQCLVMNESDFEMVSCNAGTSCRLIKEIVKDRGDSCYMDGAG